VSLVLFALGWTAGWLVLWRTPRLPAHGARTEPVSIVVPARDEAGSIGVLLASVRPQLREGDQLIVVDDHSTDGTGAIAAKGNLDQRDQRFFYFNN